MRQRINLRQVLTGSGAAASIPRHERLTFLASLLLGVAVGVAAGSGISLAMAKIASIDDDYVTVAGAMLGVPLVAPRGWTLGAMVPYMLGLAVAIACIGAARLTRPLLLSYAMYNAQAAHTDFDECIAEGLTEPRSSAGSTRSDVASSTDLLRVLQPFFRLGAGMGLSLSAVGASSAALAGAMGALASAVAIACLVYRQGSVRQRSRQQEVASVVGAAWDEWTDAAAAAPVGARTARAGPAMPTPLFQSSDSLQQFVDGPVADGRPRPVGGAAPQPWRRRRRSDGTVGSVRDHK